MTVWEYKTLQLPVVPERSPGRDSEHPIGQRLAKLGSQGWELVATCLCDDPRWSVFVLKRAAAEAPEFAARSAGNGIAAGLSRCRAGG